MPYVIDTSALIDGRRRYYPPSVFPGLWEAIEDLIDAGELIAPEEVLNDLARQDDEVHAWVRTQASLFIPLDEAVQVETTAILAVYDEWIPEDRSRNVADAFVVALARVRKWPVVSGEKWSNSPNPAKVAIPNVCDALRVHHFSFLEMLQDLRWTFHRR